MSHSLAEPFRQFCTNHVAIALVSSSALLFLGASGRSIIRGQSRHNWYLGFDASLTAVFSAIVYFFDVAQEHSISSAEIEVTTMFLLLSLMLFFVVVNCHQSWEKEDKKDRPKTQILVLGVFANVIGFGLLIAFTLLVKGVK